MKCFTIIFFLNFFCIIFLWRFFYDFHERSWRFFFIIFDDLILYLSGSSACSLHVNCILTPAILLAHMVKFWALSLLRSVKEKHFSRWLICDIQFWYTFASISVVVSTMNVTFCQHFGCSLNDECHIVVFMEWKSF